MPWLPLSRSLLGIPQHMKRNGLRESRAISEESVSGICSDTVLFCLYLVLNIFTNFRVIYSVLVDLSRTRIEAPVDVLLLRLSLISFGILAFTVITIANILFYFHGQIIRNLGI